MLIERMEQGGKKDAWKEAGREKGLEETDRHNGLPISQDDCEDKMINWIWYACKKNILLEFNIY